MDWIKFSIAYTIMLACIWFLDFVGISFLWKVGFSIAAAIGVFIALEYGAINPHRGR